jgi:Uri superfamily endonuclease
LLQPFLKKLIDFDFMDSGAYFLKIYLETEQEIQISKLGKFVFRKGFYGYSGNAKKNLNKRVSRHLRKTDKKLKWHIDFFLNNTYVSVKDYFLFYKKNECKINKFFISNGGKILIKKFGASDCKNNCLSHFLFFGHKLKVSKQLIRNFGGVDGRLRSM